MYLPGQLRPLACKIFFPFNMKSAVMNRSCLFAFGLCILGIQPYLVADEPTLLKSWPAFLGQGAGTIDPTSIPLQWSDKENIAWKTDLPGQGQSSPIIWNDNVYVTSIEGTMKEKCYLLGVALADGSERWRVQLDSAQPVRSTYTQSRSAPTPCADSAAVYAFFETGNVAAVSHQGEILWQRELTNDYEPFESTIGLAASPTLHEGLLYILVDHEGPSYLLALDTKSGETVWKTERYSRSSYASPSIISIAGKPQIVCSSSGSIDGYDPQTGEMLWTFDEGVGGNRTGAPLQIADGMFAIGASPGMHNEREEQAKETNFVMQVKLVEGQYLPSVLWRTTEAMPSFNSPMAHHDCVYWVNRVGVVYCYDLMTGKNHYTKRTNGVCWVTPIGLGDRVYLFGKDGITTVLAAGAEFKILAENRLWDPEVAGQAERSRKGRTDRGHGPDAEHNAEKEHSADEGSRSEGERVARRQLTSDPQSDDEDAEAKRFADPVQYGVAIVDGHLVIRTGSALYCVRK
jgi:outer membrane protein assembly factor BamB